MSRAREWDPSCVMGHDYQETTALIVVRGPEVRHHGHE